MYSRQFVGLDLIELNQVAAHGGGGECFCGFHCGLLLILSLSLGEQQHEVLGFVVGQFIARSPVQNAGKGGGLYQNDGSRDFVAGRLCKQIHEI